MIVTGFQSSAGPPVLPGDDRVAQEVLVVAVGEVVGPRVRAAALLAREPGDDHAVGELEQEAELERLGEVVVEHLALVVDDDALVALAQAGDDLPLLLHLLLAAEDAEVLVHRRGELVADRPRALALVPVEQRLELGLGVAAARQSGTAASSNRNARSAASQAGAPAEGDRLHQRVAAEPVRAVDRDAGDLAGRVQALERRAAPDVGVDAAHVVVGARAGPGSGRRSGRCRRTPSRARACRAAAR